MIPLGPVLAALLVAPVPWCDRERGAVDLHVDLPFQVHYRERPVDLREPGGDVSAAHMRRGCVRTLVLSLFDMEDGVFDSMVILAHFQWTCSGEPPFTTPAG